MIRTYYGDVLCILNKLFFFYAFIVTENNGTMYEKINRL